MADVSKLNVYGTSYNIRDITARTNAAISALYDQDSETITFEL